MPSPQPVPRNLSVTATPGMHVRAPRTGASGWFCDHIEATYWHRALVPPRRLAVARRLSRYIPRRRARNELGDDAWLHIDPRIVTHRINLGSRLQRRVRRPSLVWTGEWDRRIVPYRDRVKYRRLIDIHAHRHDIARSETRQHLIRQYQRGDPVNYDSLVLDSEAKVDAYLAQCVEMFASLERDGIDPELVAKRPIEIAVGRDGELLKTGNGNHRLSMAQIIGLHVVPVQVRSVHHRWLQGWLDRTAVDGRVSVAAALRAGLQALAAALDPRSAAENPMP